MKQITEYEVTRLVDRDRDVDHVTCKEAVALIADPPDDLLSVARIVRFGDDDFNGDEYEVRRQETILYEKEEVNKMATRSYKGNRVILNGINEAVKALGYNERLYRADQSDGGYYYWGDGNAPGFDESGVYGSRLRDMTVGEWIQDLRDRRKKYFERFRTEDEPTAGEQVDIKNPCPDRSREENRVRAMKGNQARIALLKLIERGCLDHAKWADIKEALEIAESYHPESELQSF